MNIRLLALAFLSFISLRAVGQNECLDTIYVSFDYSTADGFLHTDFVVDNMEDLISFQMNVSYDPSLLALTGISSEYIDDMESISVEVLPEGIIQLSSIEEPNITVPNGEAFIRLSFAQIGSGEAFFDIVDSPTETWFSSSTQLYCYEDTPSSFVISQIESPCIELSFENTSGSAEVISSVRVNNFEDILSLQFTINFDSDALMFDTLTSNSLTDFGPMHFANPIDGAITVSWFDENFITATLADGAELFEIKFTPITTEETSIEIINNPTVVEIINGNLEEKCLVGYSSTLAGAGVVIQGSVFLDENLDCLMDESETLQQWTLAFDNGNEIFYGFTSSDGSYHKLLPDGDYTVSLLALNDLWSVCAPIQTGPLVEGDSSIIFMGAQISEFCVRPKVSISAPLLRRCFSNSYYLDFCNIGTEVIEGGSIEVNLDPYVDFLSTSHVDYDLDGQKITFNLDPLAIGECGKILIEVYVQCDETELGQTHCTSAEIFPHDPCNVDISPEWSGASLSLTAECESDEVVFTIENSGNGNMDDTQAFIVIEDDVMKPVQEDEVDLLIDEKKEIRYPANGSTYRLLIDQVPFHPGKSKPTVAIEGCGQNDDGNYSLGFVSMFPQDDEDEYIDIDCQENIGSYDPNDKASFPKGYRENHQIKANTSIEYKVRFQNTGTDTAFNIVVIDTLSEFVDVTSIRFGSSSHPFSFDFGADRSIIFTFSDILLVDSFTNEVASHGFVHFTIDQVKDLEPGTIIYNEADIYFDFNAAITTNQLDLMIDLDFVEMASATEDFHSSHISLTPNPSDGIFRLELDGNVTTGTKIQIYNAGMSEVYEQELKNGDSWLNLSHLPSGVYLGVIKTNEHLIGHTRIIVL